MKAKPSFDPGGFGIVMTDLFISSTAALLIVLAVSKPTPINALPIQADLVATCHRSVASDSEWYAVFRAGHDAARDDEGIVVKTPQEMAEAPTQLGLQARLFYSVALAIGAHEQAFGECLHWFTYDLVRAHNTSLSEPRNGGPVGSRAVFAVSPTPMGLPIASENSDVGQ